MILDDYLDENDLHFEAECDNFFDYIDDYDNRESDNDE